MRILIAGIGNIFLGDDGFGSEVAQRLLLMQWPGHVTVADYGIRGLDLTYALCDGFDAAILIDAVPRGEKPGTLFVIEPDAVQPNFELETHAMNPMRVLAAAKAMGDLPRKILVLGCEPAPLEDDEERMGLSQPVEDAVNEAVRMTRALMAELSNLGDEHAKQRSDESSGIDGLGGSSGRHAA